MHKFWIFIEFFSYNEHVLESEKMSKKIKKTIWGRLHFPKITALTYSIPYALLEI